MIVMHESFWRDVFIESLKYQQDISEAVENADNALREYAKRFSEGEFDWSAKELKPEPALRYSHKKPIENKVYPQDWVGLWYTTDGEFIEVIDNEEAYFINRTNGARIGKCRIVKDGYVEVDEIETTSLIKRQISLEEKFVRNTKVKWPVLVRP